MADGMVRITRRVASWVVLAVAVIAAPTWAEPGWIRGEVHLNLRTGPGTEFRILGSLATGDKTEILARADVWTQVRLEDGREGWIPAGYLQSEPPPTLRLAQLEERLGKLRTNFEATSSEANALRTENAQLTKTSEVQASEVDRLGLEVLRLSAGARWPEWITGAAILVVGMLLGAMLHRNATRRPSTRIRM